MHQYVRIHAQVVNCSPLVPWSLLHRGAARAPAKAQGGSMPGKPPQSVRKEKGKGFGIVPPKRKSGRDSERDSRRDSRRDSGQGASSPPPAKRSRPSCRCNCGLRPCDCPRPPRVYFLPQEEDNETIRLWRCECQACAGGPPCQNRLSPPVYRVWYGLCPMCWVAGEVPIERADSSSEESGGDTGAGAVAAGSDSPGACG